MAFLSSALRTAGNMGVFGPVGTIASAILPKGTGDRVAQTIANTGQKYNLPELGASELFGAFQPTKAYAAEGNVLGSQNESGSGGANPIAPSNRTNNTGNNYNPSPQPINPSPDNNNGVTPPGGGGGSEMDQINTEYNNFMSAMDNSESLSKQRFADTESAINSETERGLKDVDMSRANTTQELANKAEGGRANERLNLQKVRQLLQDLDQRNSARLAISGGGSFGDALADRFARTAQQSVGGVQQEGQRYQNDVQLEQAKADQFYTTKSQEIKDIARNNIGQARYQLNDALGQIDQARRASAAEKQTARYNAWRSYYDNVNRAKLEAANFMANYDMWKKQMDAQLAATTGASFGNNISGQNFANTLNQTYQSVAGINPNVQSGMMDNPGVAATYFNPGVSPDQNEDDYLKSLND